jgi:hypothetical protein
MRDMNRSDSMALRRSFPLPRICSCPANSDRSRGLILQAKGGSEGSMDRDSSCEFFLRFLRPTNLLQKGWHGLVKATEREGPDQNTQKPEEFPDDRELVEFFNDSNDKSIHAVITCILSITSVPGVSFLYIYV